MRLAKGRERIALCLQGPLDKLSRDSGDAEVSKMPVINIHYHICFGDLDCQSQGNNLCLFVFLMDTLTSLY